MRLLIYQRNDGERNLMQKSQVFLTRSFEFLFYSILAQYVLNIFLFVYIQKIVTNHHSYFRQIVFNYLS